MAKDGSPDIGRDRHRAYPVVWVTGNRRIGRGMAALTVQHALMGARSRRKAIRTGKLETSIVERSGSRRYYPTHPIGAAVGGRAATSVR